MVFNILISFVVPGMQKLYETFLFAGIQVETLKRS